MRSQQFSDALAFALVLEDDELIELHRHVSRLARAAYGRQPRYQENYRASLPRARAAMAEARARTAQKHDANAGTRPAP